MNRLITLAAWKRLPPFQQGFALYMEAAWPGSELKRVKNPYVKETAKWQAFCQGQQQAVQLAQDSEE